MLTSASYKKISQGQQTAAFSLLPLPSLGSVAVSVPVRTHRRESATAQEERHLEGASRQPQLRMNELSQGVFLLNPG